MTGWLEQYLSGETCFHRNYTLACWTPQALDWLMTSNRCSTRMKRPCAPVTLKAFTVLDKAVTVFVWLSQIPVISWLAFSLCLLSIPLVNQSFRCAVPITVFWVGCENLNSISENLKEYTDSEKILFFNATELAKELGAPIVQNIILLEVIYENKC